MSLRFPSRALAAHAAAQAAAVLTLFFFSPDTWPNALLQVFAGWSSAAAVWVTVLRRRPAGRLGWFLVGLGVFLNATGILVAAILTSRGIDANSTFIVHAFWLSLFPAAAGGLAILIRRRAVERDWASLVDAAIIVTGFGLLSWVVLVRPSVTSHDGSLFDQIVDVAYPIGDLALLGMMVRTAIGGSRRSGAGRLVLCSLFAFFAWDMAWATLPQLHIYPMGTRRNLLLAGPMIAYALTGAAALHPSSTAFATPCLRAHASVGPLLLGGLTIATLIAPVVLAAESAQGMVKDGFAIAICAGILFGLVVVRMAQLVRRLEERTGQLADRNQAARLVLDTIHEGLLRIGPDGMLRLERSARVDRWLRPLDAPVSFVEYVREFDPDFALAFELGYEVLTAGVMPAEVCLAQLPAQLRCKDRDYKVTYLPVHQGERPDGLLVVLQDVTDELRLARKDADQRELLAMFEALTRDAPGFLAFFEEASRLVGRLMEADDDLETRKRAIHTLKGNASMVPLAVIVQLCDAAENAMASSGAEVAGPVEALHERWLALADAFRKLAGERVRSAVVVPSEEVADLCREVFGGLSPGRIVERLGAWRDEPVERPLRRLGDHARALAARLGKGDLRVDVEAAGVRLDPERWTPLWSQLVHVVRNAVDHGLESPGERGAAGKALPARLRLAASTAQGRLVLEIEDDGRGMDWDAIRRAAQRRGLPARTEADLTAILLARGVSSRDRSTTVSGRGIGMPAVAECVYALGGEVTLVSRGGHGTTWRFSFPRATVAQSRPSEAPRVA